MTLLEMEVLAAVTGGDGVLYNPQQLGGTPQSLRAEDLCLTC